MTSKLTELASSRRNPAKSPFTVSLLGEGVSQQTTGRFILVFEVIPTILTMAEGHERCILIAMDGSEHSDYAFECEYILNFHSPDHRQLSEAMYTDGYTTSRVTTQMNDYIFPPRALLWTL